MNPRAIGRFAGGAKSRPRENAVINRPARPNAAVARPTVRAGGVRCMPQTANPVRSRNMAIV